ncbi:hypothetical protein BpHYR1_011831 [Brachionus plicatilis]|uniref:Uncharacterized protein n=1 Tax=Brachionus plicatilis TaxID=10195 RepID=A0A3M7RVY9_BRAPC|nr:hypothetical protein BpHYR1_011831 [Brachionus plicatilis]
MDHSFFITKLRQRLFYSAFLNSSKEPEGHQNQRLFSFNSKRKFLFELVKPVMDFEMNISREKKSIKGIL